MNSTISPNSDDIHCVQDKTFQLILKKSLEKKVKQLQTSEPIMHTFTFTNTHKMTMDNKDNTHQVFEWVVFPFKKINAAECDIVQ